MGSTLEDDALKEVLSGYRDTIGPSIHEIDGLWCQLESAVLGDASPQTGEGTEGTRDFPSKAASGSPPSPSGASGSAAPAGAAARTKIFAVGLGTAIVGTGLTLALFAEDPPELAPSIQTQTVVHEKPDPSTDYAEADSTRPGPAFVPDAESRHAQPPPTALHPTAPHPTAPHRTARHPTEAAASTSSSKPRSSQGTRHRATTAAPSTPAATRAGLLREEARSLARADAALRVGTPERALELLDRHRREFPIQALEAEARGLRTVVLCRLERPESAARARRDLESQPGSKFTWRIRSACGL
ncbi:MAG: hypothetical protein V3V08_26140 [Nannocystaceae bacterium]